MEKKQIINKKEISSKINFAEKDSSLKNEKSNQFGIEVEFSGITRKHAANIVAKYFNSSIKAIDKDFEIFENNNKIWKIVRDGSIEPDLMKLESNIDNYRVELITPICVYKDLENLKSILKNIRTQGGYVNSTCGLHIHLDASLHTLITLRNLLTFWYIHQDIILNHFGILPNRLKNTCKKIDIAMIQKLHKKKIYSVEDFKNIWYEGFKITRKKYNKSRYRVINMHSLFTLGTIEFRFFNGTIDENKIQSYVDFCQAINYYILNNSSIFMPAYSSMKKLLNSLSLNHEQKKRILSH